MLTTWSDGNESESVISVYGDQNERSDIQIKGDHCKRLLKDVNGSGPAKAGQQSSNQTISNAKNSAKKKPKKTVLCDFKGCAKLFKNDNDLNTHKLTKHSHAQKKNSEKSCSATKSKNKVKEDVPRRLEAFGEIFNNENQFQQYQSAENISLRSNNIEEAVNTLTFETKQVSSNNENSVMVCDYEDCKLTYNEVQSLQKHRIEMHPIPLRCLFSGQCMNSNVTYSGMQDLQSHITAEHAASFSQQICPFNECPDRIPVSDWFVLLKHMIEEHTNDLLR